MDPVLSSLGAMVNGDSCGDVDGDSELRCPGDNLGREEERSFHPAKNGI